MWGVFFAQSSKGKRVTFFGDFEVFFFSYLNTRFFLLHFVDFLPAPEEFPRELSFPYSWL